MHKKHVLHADVVQQKRAMCVNVTWAYVYYITDKLHAVMCRKLRKIKSKAGKMQAIYSGFYHAAWNADAV